MLGLMHKERTPHLSLLGTARLVHPSFAPGEDCSPRKQAGDEPELESPFFMRC